MICAHHRRIRQTVAVKKTERGSHLAQDRGSTNAVINLLVL